MKRRKNLAELTRDISGRLLDSMYLAEVLEEQIDGEAKSDIILKILKNNMKSAFYNIEECRKVIAIID